MMRAVWHVLGDVHDAEDAFQDALTIIVKRWDRVICHNNPQALIVKICIDCAWDRLRCKLRLKRRRKALDVFEEPPGLADPVQQIERHELRQEIQVAISKLSPNQASAFLLRSTEERSYDDIAAALGCSVVTARKHVARARKRLATLLRSFIPLRRSTL
jgi:RNA polymerase sigma-70 factor (ECF subfamily)